MPRRTSNLKRRCWRCRFLLESSNAIVCPERGAYASATADRLHGYRMLRLSRPLMTVAAGLVTGLVSLTLLERAGTLDPLSEPAHFESIVMLILVAFVAPFLVFQLAIVVFLIGLVTSIRGRGRWPAPVRRSAILASLLLIVVLVGYAVVTRGTDSASGT